MKTSAAILLAGILMTGNACAVQTADTSLVVRSSGSPFRYEQRVDLTEDASGLSGVEIDEISGTVTVTGRSDASEVTILATKYATAPSERMGRELLAATEVLVRRNGETLSIETRLPERGLLGRSLTT